MIRLPLVLRRPKSRLTYGLIWLPYICFYQLINRFPVFEPRELPMTASDQAVPFVPELLPVYVAYIPFFWWTGARSENDETATRFFYATHFQLFVCAAVWLLYPVTMPRDLFYAADLYNWADAFWRWFDGPNNCLPSLHAANCLLFIQFNWNRPSCWLHTAVAAAIIASTVLVKQHYLIDLAAGAVVSLAARALLARLELTEWSWAVKRSRECTPPVASETNLAPGGSPTPEASR